MPATRPERRHGDQSRHGDRCRPILSTFRSPARCREGQLLTANAIKSRKRRRSLTSGNIRATARPGATLPPGGTARTYAGRDRQGDFVNVIITDTADNGGGSTSATATTATKVVDVAPTRAASVSGTVKEGATSLLTATSSDDRRAATGAGVAYQWQHSTNGSTWTNVASNGVQLRWPRPTRTTLCVQATFTDDTSRAVSPQQRRHRHQGGGCGAGAGDADDQRQQDRGFDADGVERDDGQRRGADHHRLPVAAFERRLDLEQRRFGRRRRLPTRWPRPT